MLATDNYEFQTSMMTLRVTAKKIVLLFVRKLSSSPGNFIHIFCFFTFLASMLLTHKSIIAPVGRTHRRIKNNSSPNRFKMSPKIQPVLAINHWPPKKRVKLTSIHRTYCSNHHHHEALHCRALSPLYFHCTSGRKRICPTFLLLEEWHCHAEIFGAVRVL